MLEVPQGNISSPNIKTGSSDKDIKIINDTFDYLTVHKDTYSYFYLKGVCSKGCCKQQMKNILRKLKKI